MGTPFVTSRSVELNGTIRLEFSEPIVWDEFKSWDFIIYVNGRPQSVYFLAANFQTLYIRTDAPIYSGITDIDIYYFPFSGVTDSLKSAATNDPVGTFYLDNISNFSTQSPLQALSITRVNSFLTNQSTIYFLVTFSESVASHTVDVSDFQLASTGFATGNIGTPFQVSASSWYVPVESVSGMGTL
jgi:hypothetical protein